MGLKSPVGIPNMKKMNILLSEANSERVTDSGKEGYEKIAS
jgi:hypothetical protein